MTKTFKITIGVLIITALAVLLVSIPKRINNDNDNGNVIVQPIEEQEPTIEETEEIEEIVPSEDIDTTNWKTYRNEEYGFSFKYPEGWEIRDITSTNAHIKNLLGLYVGAPETLTFDSFFQIQIISVDFDRKIDELRQLPEERDNRKRMFSDWIKVFGKRAYKDQWKNLTNGLLSSSYYFNIENDTLIINGTLGKDELKNGLNYYISEKEKIITEEERQATENAISAFKVASQILSTFQFTK